MKSEIYRSAQNAAAGGVLDAEIYDAEMIEAFASQAEPSIERYLDIPIGTLIALKPRPFYPPGSSWRDAAQKLDCDGWDDCRDEIVDYFTSDLREKPFPAPGASLELRIGFAGGAAYCRLGNHRAAAAKAWLAGNYGENAILKQAKCYYCNIPPRLKSLMRKCLEKGYTLKYSHAPTGHYDLPKHFSCNLVRVERGASQFDIYDLNTFKNSLTLIEPSKNVFSRLFRVDLRSKYSRRDFQEVPASLIKEILDDSKIIKLFEK